MYWSQINVFQGYGKKKNNTFVCKTSVYTTSQCSAGLPQLSTPSGITAGWKRMMGS